MRALPTKLAKLARPMFATPLMRFLAYLGLCAAYLQCGLALRFRELPIGMERIMAANSFLEHLGLVGGFLLVAWLDLNTHSNSNAEV